MRAIPFTASLIGEVELLRRDDTPGVAREAIDKWIGADHPANFNVRLAASELVTNAVRYATAGGVVWLRLFDLGGSALRLEVQDAGTALEEEPILDPPQDDIENSMREGGRGLFIVDAISSDWGATVTKSGGFLVWCVIPNDDPNP
ncbi:ATP-binding protein [Sphaerisporangium album]|nr:ATP-binding protein [Sphaerisporangium album]